MSNDTACGRYTQQLALLIGSTNIHNDLNTIIADILELFPDTHVEATAAPHQHRPRVQRGLGTWFGETLGYLFDLTTKKDSNLMKMTLEQMVVKRNEDLTQFKKFTTQLASFAQKTNEAIENIENNVKAAALSQLDLISVSEYNTQQELEHLTKITIKMQQVIYHGTQLRSKYAQLLEALQDLAQGRISPILISPEMIKKIMTYSQNETHTSFLKIAFPISDWVYKHAQFTVMRDRFNLLITLHFPLTAMDAPMDLFRVRTVALPTYDKDGKHVLKLTGLPEVVALSKNRQQYLGMSYEELVDCQAGNRGINRPLIRRLPIDSCLGTLIRQDKEQVKINCKYAFEIGMGESNVILLSAFDPTRILIIQSRLTVTCNRGSTVINCTACVYSLPPGCVAGNEDFYVVSETTNRMPNESRISHVINIPWLQSILGDDQKLFMENMDLANMMDQSLKIQNLPSLKTLNDSMNKIFASADNNKLGLKEAADAIKKESDVIQNLGQAVYYGSILTPDTWTSDFGIVLITFSCVAGLNLLFEIFVVYRLNALQLGMLVLQRLFKRGNAEMVINFVESTQFKTNKTGEVNVVLQHVRDNQATATSLFLVLIITGFLLYRCWHYMYKRAKKYQCVFGLQFQTKGEFLMAPMIVLNGLSEDFRLESRHFISDLDVVICGRPRLKFSWPTAQVINLVTQEVIQIDAHIYDLCFKHAWQLRRILRKEIYSCLPAIMDRNGITRMTTHEPESGPLSLVTLSNLETV